MAEFKDVLAKLREERYQAERFKRRQEELKEKCDRLAQGVKDAITYDETPSDCEIRSATVHDMLAIARIDIKFPDNLSTVAGDLLLHLRRGEQDYLVGVSLVGDSPIWSGAETADLDTLLSEFFEVLKQVVIYSDTE